MNKTENILPPYPRLGEIYRALAVAVDTKAGNRDVDRLAREGEFDWSLLPTLGEQLLVRPLAKYIDCKFAELVDQSIRHFHASYVNLVSTVSLDSLNRNESLPVLVEHYFSLQGLGLIYGVKNGLGGPDLMLLFEPDLHPVTVVLEWLDQGEKQPLASIAFPEGTTADRTEFEMIRKWKNGTHLPDLQSIVRYGALLSRAGVIQAEKIRNLRVWLIIARALAQMEKESPFTFRGIMRRQLLLGIPDIDIGRILSTAVIESGQRYSALTMPALMLYENLKRTTQKEEGDQTKTKAELDEFECMSARVEPEGRTRFHIEWLRGRWYILSGDFGAALPHYERAAELANYRAGDQQKQIVREALVLAAHLRKKTILKRLKHRAVAFGLFAAPRTDDVVEDWEIDHFGQHFHRVFPVHGRFTEAPLAAGRTDSFPFLAIDEKDISRIKPDLRKPDRVVSIRFADGQVRRWPQLRFFAAFSRIEEVELLLSNEAGVDQLDESGGSALLCAIQAATRTGDRRILDSLLMHPHSKATLNSVTMKKQLTPLLCAVELGESDVVEKLLAMGAAADLRGNVIDETPLYSVMSRIALVRNPEMLYRYLHDSLQSDPDTAQREILRRYNVSMTGVFGDGRALAKLRDFPQYGEMFESLVSAMVEEQIRRHSLSKLIRIIELLLQCKANPNAQHRYPAPGRTPLMLAAENNSVPAFDLMIRYGGDPFHTDAAGLNCPKIAMGFCSSEVVDYMRSKGII
jgi:ankyrin repeat protein